jgi:branched-chain amino acid transport system substrate-binding protein
MKRFLLIALVVALAGALVLGGCKAAPTTPAPAPTAPPTAAGPSEIKIGLVGAMTGGAAGFGKGCSFGAQAAVDDINKLGGINLNGTKVPVKLIIVDDESDPNKAGPLAENLILTDKVVALLNTGPLNFNPPVSIVAERYKVPFIEGPGPFEARQAVRETISPPWKYSWGQSFAIGTPAPEGDYRYGKPGYTMFDTWEGALKSFIDKTNKKIALLATDDPDGVGWYQSFAPLAQKVGLETYRTDDRFGIMPESTTDFTTLITAWKQADCQLSWSNSPAPFFGAFWKQAHTMGYRPKQVFATRSGLFYTDVKAWGGDLPNAVCNEMFWNTSYKDAPGIGGTTPQSLGERWTKETGEPLNQGMGWLYADFQIVADAIERAGSLDGAAINEALRTTDLKTINSRIQFDKDQFNRMPVAFGQWQKTNNPWVWENPTVFTMNDIMVKSAEMIFPIPY